MIRLPRRVDRGDEAMLVEHVEELRWRIVVMLAAVALATVVAYLFHTQILDWLDRPLPAGRRHVVTLGIAEPLTVTLTVSLYAGVVLSLPVILWQVWSFFAPALDPALERRLLGLVGLAAGLGATGLAFGYWILLPRAIHWLTSYDNAQYRILIRARDYYSFVSTVLLGIVGVFELPLVILGLVALRVLTSDRLRRNRRLGYFIVAAVALALPGPDPVTTALELLPMWALFEGSIWLAVLTEHRAARSSLLQPATPAGG